jgi:hypothetical protein
VTGLTSAVITRLFCICTLLLLRLVGAAFAEGTYQHTKDGKTIVWNDDPKPGDTATWVGDRDAEGYAIKAGTLTWYNARGTVYAHFRGNMVRGKFNGTVNGYSKGKRAHAIFVAGQRTTRWAAGTAPLFKVAQTPPVNTTEKIAKGESAEPRNPSLATGHPAPSPSNRQRDGSASKTSQTLTRQLASEDAREKTRQPVFALDPVLLRENPTPNVENVTERASQAQSQNAAANELSSEKTPPTPSVAAAGKAFAGDDLKRAEPEPPAEGPRVAPTENAPMTASPSSGGDLIEDKPPDFTPSPDEAVANRLATSEKKVEADGSVQSAASSHPISKRVASPQTSPRLTSDQVVKIANVEVSKRGYSRANYRREEPQFKADYKTWSVSYEPITADGMETTGKHFSVIIDDRTKGAIFLLRK